MTENPQAQDDAPYLQHTKIQGRFDQYRSSYWAAAVALWGARYGIRPFVRKFWDEKSTVGHFWKHAYAFFAGAIMYGVTLFYGVRTLQDMRNVFAETLAWEFNKDAKDVSLRDVFKSQNNVVKETRKNFLKYNARRFGINTVFFTPYLPGTSSLYEKYKLHPESGADFGLAANAAYLFSDVISRRMTFFEELQAFVDRKINHADNAVEQIGASDLINLYERHAREHDSLRSFGPQKGTPQWEANIAFFERMATLMNQTYKNAMAKEHADFGVPKLLFLMGNGLIDPKDMERTRAYMEVANRYGIPALKKLVADAKQGMPLAEALKAFPVSIPSHEPVSIDASPQFEANQQKMTARVGKRDKLATMPPPASHVQREEGRPKDAGMAVGKPA